MSSYYEKKNQFQELVEKHKNAKSEFGNYVESRKKELTELIDYIKKEKDFIENLISVQQGEFKKERERLDKIKAGIDELARQRQVGFPWLADAYKKLSEYGDKFLIYYMKKKKRPALRAAEEVERQQSLRREAEKELMIAQGIISYYESIAPFLIEYREEVDIPSEEEINAFQLYSDEEKQDEVTHFLSIDEYKKLPVAERNQLALDRYWKRPKSKWMIGKIYERYIGYKFESEGYDVEYVGIKKGLEDLGRDLICKKENEIIVVQCKNWSQFRVIHEKHIFQFFGTIYRYKFDNPKKTIRGLFCTSTSLSEIARGFSRDLNIELREEEKFDQHYPSIKCNISQLTGEKIYHLPMDQRYDDIKIEPKKGEKYCLTIKEAEELGFRRAKRYMPNKTV